MMQITNVKPVSKTQLANKAIHPTLIKQSEKLDVNVTKSTEPNKTPSFNRFLEAYSDCV
jgi:hypothetical protein